MLVARAASTLWPGLRIVMAGNGLVAGCGVAAHKPTETRPSLYAPGEAGEGHGVPIVRGCFPVSVQLSCAITACCSFGGSSGMNSCEQAARAGCSVLQLVCQGESMLKMLDKFTALLCRVFMPNCGQTAAVTYFACDISPDIGRPPSKSLAQPCTEKKKPPN